MELHEQLKETWRINNQINLMILDNITEACLDFTLSSRGGGKIGHQFAHLYNVRYWKMEGMNKAALAELATIKSTDEKTIPMLKDLLTISRDLIAAEIEKSIESDYQIKGFKRGVVPLIGYFTSHEAHHRGNILLVLKQKGFKLPNELKYGIWEWNKI
jgi:uncharacterized damage-inducible protein DinB